MKEMGANHWDMERIERLRSFNILDTSQEQEFNEIVELASLICETPISLVSLIDIHRQWFKAKVGVDVDETARDISFCTHAIEQYDLMIVPDTLEDPRFVNNPLVTGDVKVRFYAGMPITTKDGHNLGTLCVIDNKPRNLTEKQLLTLQTLAKQVMRQIELRQSVITIDAQKRVLLQANDELTKSNKELYRSEAAVKDNLKQIKVLQANLEEREKQYRGMVENATDLIYEMDERGIFTFVNPGMEIVSGYTRDQLLAKGYWDLVHPLHMDNVVSFYGHQRRHCIETTYLEFMMATRTGKIVWIGQNVRMFYNGDGHVTKVGAISRDITDLKRAEQRLENSEQRFRSLTDSSPVGIFETDANGKCTYVNRKWCEMTGLTAEEARGDGWANAIHHADRKTGYGDWKDNVAISGEFVKEIRLVDRAGKIRWVTSRSVQITGENGQITGYIGTTDDITELKEMHLKLEQREELYRLISTNSGDMITLFKNDEAATRVYVSPSSKTILGYDPEELIAKSPYEIIYADDVPVIRAFISELKSTGQTCSCECRMIRKDGQIIWMESNAKPWFDSFGRMTGFQASAREITRRKEFEQSLRESKEKAEEATIAKSRFLSMMSHEIRTPMNAIIGLTNLLLQGDPTDEQHEQLSLLKFSGENLLTIINDILDFSKIEAERIALESIHFNLRELVINITGMMDQRVKEKNISFELQYDESIPRTVVGDPVRLAQIITNLAGNAVKFTEQGGIQLKLQSLGNDQGKHRIRFTIEDTGIGIPQDKIHSIFEQFSQADSDTTRRFGGTGLGLSITKSLLQLMGSEIGVESVVGVGSKFSFILALEGEQFESVIKPASAAPVANFKDMGISVLLVEDNRVNQIVASNFLRKWGIKIEIANNGQEALDMIVKGKYNLVLMDIQMPVMDGYEASRRIRQMEDPHLREIPIIALTASAMLGMRDKVMEVGMNDFVTKPFVPADLQQTIQRFVLDRSVAG